MEHIRISELFAKLKPFILDVISTVGGGAGPFAPTPHDLSSGHHTGSIGDAQAPQFLKVDGSRQLNGNLWVADGITIDGVDISTFKMAYDTHAGLNAAAAHGSVGAHNHQSNPAGGLLDHGLALSGLGDDDHTQYAHADGSGTRRAYEAERLNKSMVAGAGLTGGGILTADRTLDIGAGTGIVVNADDVAVDTGAAFTWTNDHTFRGLTKTRHLQPELTDTYDLGTSTLLWRKGWLSELDAIVFAQNTATLLGGWLLISKDEGAIDADVAPADTQINFGKAMTPGDFVLFRAAGKVEYMQIGSLVSGTTYNVTRNLDGSGADSWPAGTPFAVLGQNGQGRIELNAYDTPRLQMIRQGATYNAQTELIRIGDLNGNWGYTSQKWGLAIGEYASGRANITIDQDGVLRIRNFATDVIRLSGTESTIENVLQIKGTASAIAIGNPPPTSSTSGTGLWIDRTGLYSLLNGTYQIKIDTQTGNLFSGEGKIRIGSDGVNFNLSSSYDVSSAINFRDTSNTIWTQLLGLRDQFSLLTAFEITSKSDKFSDFYVNIESSTGNSGQSTTTLRNWARSGMTTTSEANLYLSTGFGSPQMTTYLFDGTTQFWFELNNSFGFRLRAGSPLVTRYNVDSNGYTTISTAISCRAIRSTDQSISSATWTAISFSSASWDDRPSGLSAQWSSGAPTRLTCRVDGLYLITGHLSFAGNATGRRIGRVYLNGSTEIALQSHPAISTNPVHITFSALRKLTAGDYVELGAFQDSGGALNVLTGTYTPVLAWTRIA